MEHNRLKRTRNNIQSSCFHRLEQRTSSRAIKMRGFNLVKHRVPQINLGSHFPHVGAIMFVMVFRRNSWLLTESAKQPPSTNDDNPNHSETQGWVRGWDWEYILVSDWGVGGRQHASAWGRNPLTWTDKDLMNTWLCNYSVIKVIFVWVRCLHKSTWEKEASEACTHEGWICPWIFQKPIFHLRMFIYLFQLLFSLCWFGFYLTTHLLFIEKVISRVQSVIKSRVK